MSEPRPVRDLQLLLRDAQRQTDRARSTRAVALEHLEDAKAVHAKKHAEESTSSKEDLARATLRMRNCTASYYSAHAGLQQQRDSMKSLRDELSAAKGRQRLQVPRTEAKRATSDLPIIEVENVSKKFSDSLRQSLRRGFVDLTKLSVGRNLNQGQLRPGEFWAVDDISFELCRGDSLGILGSNGSGKSTLARILAGVFPPDLGEVTIRGRMTSILTIGAGFHPHLNGMENIRLNAAVLGLSEEEVDDLTPGILEFAGLGERIFKPVGMYSSGMRMRLGFSVVTATQPDVMIFDEVLAVGDLDFREKCIDRLTELHDTSVLIMVAQTPQMIETFCAQALWLDNGAVTAMGPIEDIGPQFLLAHSNHPQIDLDDPIDLRKAPSTKA